MHASVGDRLIVHSTHVDGPVRDGEILEVHGPDGEPPYVVRWSDNGHEGLICPGPDASVHHFGLESDAGDAGTRASRRRSRSGPTPASVRDLRPRPEHRRTLPPSVTGEGVFRQATE